MQFFFLDHSVDSTVSYDDKFCSVPRCSVSASQHLLRDGSMSLTAGVKLEFRMARSNFLTIGQIYKNNVRMRIKTVLHDRLFLRLDYCNSLQNGISVSDNLLGRIQAVQNLAAHFVTGTGRREHITPVLRQLQCVCGYISGTVYQT